MKSVVIPRHGDFDVLEFRDVPAPELRPGTCRIQVEASGVNFADLLMRMGRYPEAPEPPFVPGYEVSGTITEVADHAAFNPPWLKPGASVMAVTRFGGYAEQVVTPTAKVCPLPRGWTHEQGAAFLINYVTAWLGLCEMARIKPGDRVLIHGIAGGVGLAALQIARAKECLVAGTCGPHKRSAVIAHGADFVLDAASEDLADAVRSWAPEGPDVVLEPRGGQGLKQSLDIVRPLGKVVLFGFREIIDRPEVDPAKTEMATGRLLWFNPLTLIERSIGVFMLNIMNLWDDPHTFRHVATQLQKGIDAKTFMPVIDRTFPLDQAAQAHRCLHERQNVGKVVLTLKA